MESNEKTSKMGLDSFRDDSLEASDTISGFQFASLADSKDISAAIPSTGNAPSHSIAPWVHNRPPTCAIWRTAAIDAASG